MIKRVKRIKKWDVTIKDNKRHSLGMHFGNKKSQLRSTNSATTTNMIVVADMH